MSKRKGFLDEAGSMLAPLGGSYAAATGCVRAAEEAGCKASCHGRRRSRQQRLPRRPAGGDIENRRPEACERRRTSLPAAADRRRPRRRRRSERRHLRDRPVGLPEAGRHRRRSPEGTSRADVYAVQQIYALRRRRFELNPYWGFSLNDQFVSHPGPGLAVNYYITNVLAVGLNGTFYRRSTATRTSTSRRAARRASRCRSPSTRWPATR